MNRVFSYRIRSKILFRSPCHKLLCQQTQRFSQTDFPKRVSWFQIRIQKSFKLPLSDRWGRVERMVSQKKSWSSISEEPTGLESSNPGAFQTFEFKNVWQGGARLDQFPLWILGSWWVCFSFVSVPIATKLDSIALGRFSSGIWKQEMFRRVSQDRLVVREFHDVASRSQPMSQHGSSKERSGWEQREGEFPKFDLPFQSSRDISTSGKLIDKILWQSGLSKWKLGAKETGFFVTSHCCTTFYFFMRKRGWNSNCVLVHERSSSGLDYRSRKFHSENFGGPLTFYPSLQMKCIHDWHTTNQFRISLTHHEKLTLQTLRPTDETEEPIFCDDWTRTSFDTLKFIYLGWSVRIFFEAGTDFQITDLRKEWCRVSLSTGHIQLGTDLFLKTFNFLKFENYFWTSNVSKSEGSSQNIERTIQELEKYLKKVL